MLLGPADDRVQFGQDGLGHLAKLCVAHLRAQVLPEVRPLADGLHHERGDLFVQQRIVLCVVIELLCKLSTAILAEVLRQLGVEGLALGLGQRVIDLVHRDRQRRVIRIVGNEDVLAVAGQHEPVGQRCWGVGLQVGDRAAKQSGDRTGSLLLLCQRRGVHLGIDAGAGAERRDGLADGAQGRGRGEPE